METDQPTADRPDGGRFEGAEHRLALRVYFEDTDLSGVVYHANYLRWMERARSDMLRLAGVDQRGAIQQGVSRGGVLRAAAVVTAALVGPDGRPRRQSAAWIATYQRLVDAGEEDEGMSIQA